MLRIYGNAPFNIAVIHGGPGAAGEMAPVARELASKWGVMEPIQTAKSLQGQVRELKAVLEKYGDLPAILIGFSWGAWLSYLISAHYPSLVKKLILIGSGPYKHKYMREIHETRLGRLNEEKRAEYESIIKILNDSSHMDKKTAFAHLGALTSKTDRYDPMPKDPDESERVSRPENIFYNVLKEALDLRKSGRLLELGKQIQCPVIAIHGDYDPHPAEGIQKPLSAILKSFRLILLHNCGHKPWIERQAMGKFYGILKEELHDMR